MIMLIFIPEEEGKICHSGILVQSCLLFGYSNENNSAGDEKNDDELKRGKSSVKMLHSEIE